MIARLRALRHRLVRDRFHAPPFGFYLYALAEPIDDRHQAINREPRQVRVANA